LPVRLRLQQLTRFHAKGFEVNHHLPDVPSASKIAETGVPLGQTISLLLRKLEELTRYDIEQNKKIDYLDSKVQKLENEKVK
jgi:hypothetical protein